MLRYLSCQPADIAPPWMGVPGCGRSVEANAIPTVRHQETFGDVSLVALFGMGCSTLVGFGATFLGWIGVGLWVVSP